MIRRRQLATWASCANSIIFYNEFACPEGDEKHAQCGKNFKKTMIFVYFFIFYKNPIWLQNDHFETIFGPKMAPKMGPKIRPEKDLIFNPKTALKKKPDRARTGSAVLGTV